MRLQPGSDRSAAIIVSQSTKRRLLDLANTLGLAPQLIRLIERGNRQDWFILFGGMAVTLAVMWFVVAYVRR